MEIQVNQITLSYEVRGQGTPLLLVHGNGEDHTIFDRAVPVLAKSYRVYAPDSRCHGASEDTKHISYDLMAEDLIAFIKKLRLEKPIFYGYSDGGIIGLLIAMQEPELLSQLLISGANLTPGGLRWPTRLQIRLAALLGGGKLWKLMDREPAISPSALQAITVPVHVLAGERDVVKPAHTRLIADSIQNSTLRILPGETHGSYIVHSEKLCGVLGEYLKKAPGDNPNPEGRKM